MPFEAECACDLKFVGMGRMAAALLARLKLEGARSGRRILGYWGLDYQLIAAAKETGLVRDCHRLMGLRPARHMETTALPPYDWGYFAFGP